MFILLSFSTVQNSGKKSKEDLWTEENNGWKMKTKVVCEGFATTTLRKHMPCEEEQNRSTSWKKTNTNASSQWNNKNDYKMIPGYRDDRHRQRNNQDLPRWTKNKVIPSNERNKWKQNPNANNDMRRILNRSNINNYSSREMSLARSLNKRKELVFDKRDFLYRDIPKHIREQIQLDEVAHYSVTDMGTADEISHFIAKLDGLKRDNIVITDGTACVGGNTFSFCKNFKKVQAVEIDETRCNMLKHNLAILGCTNARCYHSNYLELFYSLTQDVVFLDPPWGGPSYIEKDVVDLFLGDIPLDKVCEKLKRTAKYVIIKAPMNLNYEKFKGNVSGIVTCFNKFRKMLLIVVDYYHFSQVFQQKQITSNSNKYDNKTNENNNVTRNTGRENQDKDR